MIIVTMKQMNQMKENARLNILENIQVQIALEDSIKKYREWRDNSKTCDEFQCWNNSYNKCVSALEKLKLQDELNTTLFEVKN